MLYFPHIGSQIIPALIFGGVVQPPQETSDLQGMYGNPCTPILGNPRMSSVQNPCWLMFIGDYATSILGIVVIPQGNPYKPTSISWHDKGILNSADMLPSLIVGLSLLDLRSAAVILGLAASNLSSMDAALTRTSGAPGRAGGGSLLKWLDLKGL